MASSGRANLYMHDLTHETHACRQSIILNRMRLCVCPLKSAPSSTRVVVVVPATTSGARLVSQHSPFDRGFRENDKISTQKSCVVGGSVEVRALAERCLRGIRNADERTRLRLRRPSHRGDVKPDAHVTSECITLGFA